MTDSVSHVASLDSITDSFVLIVHPTLEHDLRALMARWAWEVAYRAFRRAYPRENLGPREILHKFAQDSFVAG